MLVPPNNNLMSPVGWEVGGGRLTPQPTYLVNLLYFSDICKSLRSSVSKQLFAPKTKLNIDKRAFSVAASTIWNQLPIAFKYSETIATFCKQVKTDLFEIAFPP